MTQLMSSTSSSSSVPNSEPFCPPSKTHSPLLFVLAQLPIIGLAVACYLCIQRGPHWKSSAGVAIAGGLGLTAFAAVLIYTLGYAFMAIFYAIGLVAKNIHQRASSCRNPLLVEQ
ncbi:hypothetical protein [Chlamydia suis]|uniref:Uncharacterized protein n=1 Tax=Chlamydia suis TaxID=83559 RepID=A0AAQ0EQH3_9CHLA|nr:hypothetical protein [Chlamydia suis]MEB2681111.1 hypothetical protein [Chlamydia suis]MEB2682019.1 hypothetical protein [Chlamydia suis]MEB2682942.1 hypothetical protein [Chlamydia suis]MEB2683818.1 hypothetical protein [Chlamydia suis]MEB2684756.1 hypothetical protein [Chlamydia suis]